MLLKTYYLLFVVSLLIAACTKDNPVSAGGSRLTMTIGRWHDSAGYAYFYYDQQNRLASIVDSENTNHSKRFASFVYAATGKLVESIYTNDVNSTVAQDSFWYDDDHIIKKTYSDSWNNSGNITFSYDGQGRLTGDTSYNNRTGNVFGFTDYTYDEDDNIVSWQEHHDELGVMKSWGIASASYNSSINPYYDLGVPLFVITRDNSILSKHLRKQVMYYDGTILHFVYEYYPGGNVKRLTSISTQNGYTDSTTLEFFYQ